MIIIILGIVGIPSLTVGSIMYDKGKSNANHIRSEKEKAKANNQPTMQKDVAIRNRHTFMSVVWITDYDIAAIDVNTMKYQTHR